MRSLADRIALAVTCTISPPALPPLLVWLILVWMRAPGAETAALTAATFVLLSIVPAAFLVWMVRSGRSASVNLEETRHRAAALAIGIVGAVIVAAATCFLATDARPLLLATLLAFLLTSVTLALVNRRWRISLHAASIAGFMSVAAFAAFIGVGAATSAVPTPSAVTLWCLPALFLVGWSRLHLRAHSAGQVAAGALVGLLVPFATLAVFDAFWPFSPV